MINKVPLAWRKKGNDETTNYPGQGPKRLSLPCARRGGNKDPSTAPFLTIRLVPCTHYLLNVTRSKSFLSLLILTLSWYLKKRIRWRSETLAPSYNPFLCVVPITILATARIARNTTYFSPFHIFFDVKNVEQHQLFGIDANRSRPDVTPKLVNSLAGVEGVQSS